MKHRVAICCHNGEKYIEQQIASILAQTKRVDSVHVFDFASRDATLAVLRRMADAETDVPVEIVTFPDAPGASLSFFRAFDYLARFVADDDCIFLADQDDVWHPEKVAVMAPHFAAAYASSTSKRLLTFHDVAVTDEHLNVVRPTYYTGNPFRLPRDLTADRVLLSNPAIGHTMALSGRLLALVARYTTREGYLMHDWAALLVASRFGEVHFVDRVLSRYRQHSSNVLGAYQRHSFGTRLARVSKFTTGLLRQISTFLADYPRLASAAADSPREIGTISVDRRLLRVSCAPHRLRLLLAGTALLRGPTLPRRGLGIFLLADSVLLLLRGRVG